mmetsp:Transcript_106885/g.300537  ORF Transcript_106885/g.300537 Transcript_106885/m.300537 type:complete len:509 (-) Transcript_106885:107-1633(-)
MEDMDELCFVAKKAVGGAASSVVEVTLPRAAAVGDLARRLAETEGCDASSVTLICRGVPLRDASAQLALLAEKEARDGKTQVVYLVRKPAAPPAEAAPAPALTTPTSGLNATAAPTSANSSHPAPVGQQPLAATAPAPAPDGHVRGRRVLLLLRHGQCCHQGEADALKELSQHGHQQAEESARYVASLCAAGKLPQQCALLHSTSRRARETAAKLPNHFPGIEVWNADLLRETDPTANPLRAEEVFIRLFTPPENDVATTLFVVAHNNIILYLLMRAAGVPIERACQAWRMFTLRHASVTRVDVDTSGAKHVVSIGAAGHIAGGIMTWNNLEGADMAAWKGGGPERRKLSGRMLVLVRLGSDDAAKTKRQIDAVATHLKGLSEFMFSSHVMVTCTSAARRTAEAIARQFRTGPQVLPESIVEQPEAGFLQFFSVSPERTRDTVVMVAEDGPLLYWLLRALGMSQEESKVGMAGYCIGHASVTLVNAKRDGSMQVMAVGDTGHLDIDVT